MLRRFSLNRTLLAQLRCSFSGLNEEQRILEENAKRQIENDNIRLYRKFMPYRFEKKMGNFSNFLDEVPYKERCEIDTRILKVLYATELVNLRKFRFDMDLRKDLKLDSLDITVVLTSIEHEFTTVFTDKVFESVCSLEQIALLLERDNKII